MIKTEGENQNEVEKASKELIYSEVEMIESEDICEFVKLALAEAEPQFWTAAASSTGKYHPEEDNGDGGLVRHVYKGSAGVIPEYARRAGFTQRELDLARGAFLLHDIKKNGWVWGEFTDYTHGLIASQWLEQFPLEDELAKSEILEAVRYHMGQWVQAFSKPHDREFTPEEVAANLDEVARAVTHPSQIVKAVQEADYWSSRKMMSFFPGKSIDWKD